MQSGAGSMQRQLGIPSSIVNILIGVIVVLILAKDVFHIKGKKDKGKSSRGGKIQGMNALGNGIQDINDQDMQTRDEDFQDMTNRDIQFMDKDIQEKDAKGGKV